MEKDEARCRIDIWLTTFTSDPGAVAGKPRLRRLIRKAWIAYSAHLYPGPFNQNQTR